MAGSSPDISHYHVVSRNHVAVQESRAAARRHIVAQIDPTAASRAELCELKINAALSVPEFRAFMARCSVTTSLVLSALMHSSGLEKGSRELSECSFAAPENFAQLAAKIFNDAQICRLREKFEERVASDVAARRIEGVAIEQEFRARARQLVRAG